MKRLIIFLAMSLLLTSCTLFEDYDARTYYKIEGVGYVYHENTKEPAQNVRVTVISSFKSYGWATKQAINEDFYTDNTGNFRIKFLKRTGKENVAGITVYAYDDVNKFNSKAYSYPVHELDELITKIDTLWIR